uniref:(northern house mosquito) hypothetical protein n=1 Tax=Culex pipiens TaxID=7175 RepID=A0A8D8HNT3_CULPI
MTRWQLRRFKSRGIITNSNVAGGWFELKSVDEGSGTRYERVTTEQANQIQHDYQLGAKEQSYAKGRNPANRFGKIPYFFIMAGCKLGNVWAIAAGIRTVPAATFHPVSQSPEECSRGI